MGVWGGVTQKRVVEQTNLTDLGKCTQPPWAPILLSRAPTIPALRRERTAVS
jgi:hypothetical protein